VVVASLWYVAVQLRQSTKAMVASSLQEILESDIGLISDYMQQGVDPHFIGDDVVLSPEAERMFLWQIVKVIKIREYAWHQFRSGTLDEESWESYMAPLPGIFATRRARAVLDFYSGSPEFMRFMREQLADKSRENR
jgi:hypothetical protein